MESFFSSSLSMFLPSSLPSTLLSFFFLKILSTFFLTSKKERILNLQSQHLTGAWGESEPPLQLQEAEYVKVHQMMGWGWGEDEEARTTAFSHGFVHKTVRSTDFDVKPVNTMQTNGFHSLHLFCSIALITSILTCLPKSFPFLSVCLSSPHPAPPLPFYDYPLFSV